MEVLRGSAAVAAGVVTESQLRGPNWVRVLPDTYVARGVELDLRVRSVAAFRHVGANGVLAGWSAAELLGVRAAPHDAPAEVVVPAAGRRVHQGLVLRRDRLRRRDVWLLDADGRRRPHADRSRVLAEGGVHVTSPERTAYDLARREPGLVRAVVAVDAVANACRIAPSAVLDVAVRNRGARGITRLPRVVDLADAAAGSPMETRLRLVLVLAGLPRPTVQHPVLYDDARTAVWLDLAYPEQRIGVEYEGAQHAGVEGLVRDADRYTRLVTAGWRMFRYTKQDVLRGPERIVADLRRALRPPRCT
ncbi:endonuclease domain-containing protein [Pseudonocardia sp.]|uniref:endonuclease domain-containing protein n=1 Tax=Pseudonocardia sp. TaxID=60912 RepID=UPI003D0B81AB